MTGIVRWAQQEAGPWVLYTDHVTISPVATALPTQWQIWGEKDAAWCAPLAAVNAAPAESSRNPCGVPSAEGDEPYLFLSGENKIWKNENDQLLLEQMGCWKANEEPRKAENCYHSGLKCPQSQSNEDFLLRVVPWGGCEIKGCGVSERSLGHWGCTLE